MARHYTTVEEFLAAIDPANEVPRLFAASVDGIPFGFHTPNIITLNEYTVYTTTSFPLSEIHDPFADPHHAGHLQRSRTDGQLRFFHTAAPSWPRAAPGGTSTVQAAPGHEAAAPLDGEPRLSVQQIKDLGFRIANVERRRSVRVKMQKASRRKNRGQGKRAGW